MRDLEQNANRTSGFPYFIFLTRLQSSPEWTAIIVIKYYQAETLGAQGRVDEAKDAVRQADKFKQERAALDRLLTQSANPSSHIEDLANQLAKPMEVCQVSFQFFSASMYLENLMTKSFLRVKIPLI